MEDKLLQLAYNLLAILIPVLAGFLVELLRRKLGTEKMRKYKKNLMQKGNLLY